MFGHGCPGDFDCGSVEGADVVDFDGAVVVVDGVVLVVVADGVLAAVELPLGAAAAPAIPAVAPPAASAPATIAAFQILAFCICGSSGWVR
jgi:hypothetical protein